MAGKIGSEASSSSRSGNNRGESVIVDVGWCRGPCGYCRSGGRSSVSYGLSAHSITVDDYQDLLDRGWRRSGSFLYKPEMERTCCPSYTIRLKAGDFIPSKEQIRVSRRMQRFLDGSFDGKKSELLTKEPSDSNSVLKEISCDANKRSNEEHLRIFSQLVDDAVHAWAGSGGIPSDVQLPKASVKKITQAKRKLIAGSDNLLYSSNISFQIAAAIKRSKLPEISPKIIAEKLGCFLNLREEFSGLLIKHCNGHLNFYSATGLIPSDRTAEAVDASKHFTKGDGSKDNSVVDNKEHPPKKQRTLEIRLKRSSFDPEEYDLYRRYQIRVHNDSPDHVMESSYKRFLVDTPIVFVPPRGDGTVPSCGFGSFHQQYLIDGRLVAVGVVDILPRCLSSKYLFWDPDLAFLSLGKYSALQEIDWVKKNQAHCPSLQYYYLGYYIHSCSKMRYKAAYRPSELLCPKRYEWIPFDVAKPLLDEKPYVILSDFANLRNGESLEQVSGENNSELPQLEEPDQEEDLIESLSDEDEVMLEPDSEGSEDDLDQQTLPEERSDGDVGSILIGLKNTRMRFKDLKQMFGSRAKNYLEMQMHRYMKAVGPALSERMVYLLG